jgi:hypothetical protein
MGSGTYNNNKRKTISFPKIYPEYKAISRYYSPYNSDSSRYSYAGDTATATEYDWGVDYGYYSDTSGFSFSTANDFWRIKEKAEQQLAKDLKNLISELDRIL